MSCPSWLGLTCSLYESLPILVEVDHPTTIMSQDQKIRSFLEADFCPGMIFPGAPQ